MVRLVADAPSPILQSVLRSAIEATGATQGWLLETDGNELVVRATVGADAHLLGTRVPLDAGFAGYVASSLKLLTNEPLRRTMGRRGRRVARERFSADEMVESYVKVYESLR